MSANRREFLQRLAVTGVAIGSLPSVLEAAVPSSARALGSHSVSDMLDAEQQAQDWDITWTGKLTGKHRAVFDIPEIHGGVGMWRAGLWQNHYRDILKASPSDINAVIIIRHAAIPMVMNQDYWQRYEVGKELKVTHPVTEKKTTRNPALMTAEVDAIPPMMAGLTLDKQMERGAIVLGCNMAFVSVVSTVAKQDKLSNAEARTKALSMMYPGVILQPNGIFGLTLAQENGCVFVAAS